MGHPTLKHLGDFFYALSVNGGESWFLEVIRNNRLTVEEALALFNEYRPGLEAAAAAFTADSGLAGTAAAEALYQELKDWTAKR